MKKSVHPSKIVDKKDKPMFVTWEEGDNVARNLAIYEASKALAKYEPVLRQSVGSNQYFNISNNVSVRDGFNRYDYEDFRPEETVPSKPTEIIRDCMLAYNNVGVIRNVIDLMGDFATQGIDLNHPNERIEKWYKEWFRRVGGKERSERFLNLLYRTGNVIVQRQNAKLPLKLDRQMRRSTGEADIEIEQEQKLEKREIPWKYTFKNPISTKILEESLSLFIGHKQYSFGVEIPSDILNKLKNPRNTLERELVKQVPDYILKIVKEGGTIVPLDNNKVRSFYYKKDDWELWAKPMCSAILPDLQILQKMKLADLAALDGAISSIRVWKLGNIEARILPTEAAMSRLAEMLCNNVGGGVMDLVWGPEIELVETKTDVHNFLGETKYAPILTAIYAGLGIPPTLTGASTNGGGFTNNFISLKTLTERLQYGRDLLANFWEEEIRLVQRAMGFRFPASLVFDRMTLTDESAEKNLLISLADRDMISVETLQERFGETPEIEQVRIRREMRKRKNGRMPEKASPFHKPEKEHEYKMGFLNSGLLSPSEVGLDLEERDGDKSPKELDAEINKKNQVEPKGVPGQGRPKFSNDKQKRKKKRVVPRTSAIFLQNFAWAENAQTKINTLTSSAYLKSLGKKTMRELTEEEAKAYEAYKFYILCQLDVNQEIDKKTIAVLNKKKLSIPIEVKSLLEHTIAKHCENHGKEPTLDVLRRYQAGAFSFWKGDYEEE